MRTRARTHAHTHTHAHTRTHTHTYARMHAPPRVTESSAPPTRPDIGKQYYGDFENMASAQMGVALTISYYAIGICVQLGIAMAILALEVARTC